MLKSNPPSQRVWMFDPCFGNMTGHWENYCKRFYDELIQRGYFVTVYGQNVFDAKIVADVKFKPLFSCCPFEPIKNILMFNRFSDSFLTDLNKVSPNEFHDDDLLIFHSIFPQTLAAIVNWTKRLTKLKKVKVAIFFQFAPSLSERTFRTVVRKIYHWVKSLSSKHEQCFGGPENTIKYYRASAPDLHDLVKQGSHYLFTSTEVLTDIFTKILNLPIHNLPMPAPNIMSIKPPSEGVNPVITIGYFGHSSFAKGGQFLKFIIERTLDLFPQVKFLLHVNPNSETTTCLEYFKHYQHPRLTAYHGHLSQKQMLTLMEQVDIILLPYASYKYLNTPSAVFSEGLVLKKVFVLPLNTWMAEEAKKYHAGYVGFSKYTKEKIFGALKQAIEYVAILREQSDRAGREFAARNNIAQYTTIFENIILKRCASFTNNPISLNNI